MAVIIQKLYSGYLGAVKGSATKKAYIIITPLAKIIGRDYRFDSVAELIFVHLEARLNAIPGSYLGVQRVCPYAVHSRGNTAS